MVKPLLLKPCSPVRYGIIDNRTVNMINSLLYSFLFNPSISLFKNGLSKYMAI